MNIVELLVSGLWFLVSGQLLITITSGAETRDQKLVATAFFKEPKELELIVQF